MAVQHGHKSIVRALLDAGADVDIASTIGLTPLAAAAAAADVDLARILLNAHASLSAKDEDGWTALHWAVSKRSLELAELLVNSGASLMSPTKNGNMPYDIAVNQENVTMMNFLRAKGGAAHIAQSAPAPAHVEPDKTRFLELSETEKEAAKSQFKSAVIKTAAQQVGVQVATVAVAGCCAVQ